MSAENAAYQMLATHCGICHRALRDPISVNMGIGPDCRKKCGFGPGTVTPEAYERAKALVFQLAIAASTDRIVPSEVLIASDELQTLGFGVLAETIVRRNAAIQIIPHPKGRLLLHFPYNLDASASMRRHCEARMERDARGKVAGFSIPAIAKNKAWTIFRHYFAGLLGVGPAGGFIVSPREQT